MAESQLDTGDEVRLAQGGWYQVLAINGDALRVRGIGAFGTLIEFWVGRSSVEDRRPPSAEPGDPAAPGDPDPGSTPP